MAAILSATVPQLLAKQAETVNNAENKAATLSASQSSSQPPPPTAAAAVAAPAPASASTTTTTSAPPAAAAAAAKPEEKKEGEEEPYCGFLSCLGVIERRGTFATAWAVLMTINCIISITFLIPFRIGFDLKNWKDFIGPDIFCDLVFLCNAFVLLRTSFEQDGEEVRDVVKIEERFFGWHLFIHVFGLLPLEICSLAIPPDYYEPGLRANRIVFIFLLPELFERWERLTTIKPSIVRIVKSIFVVFFCSHVIGCIFHLVVKLEGDAADISFTGTEKLNDQVLVARYFRSVFWSFVTMTGYNNTNPNTLPEAVFSFFVTLLGISLFATIIGSVGSLVTNLDSSKLYFRQKLDSINEYMSYKKIPQNLQDDVRNYFLYLWKSGKGLDKNQALDELPGYLKHKMNMFLNRDVIRNVDIFAEWKDDDNFVTEIVKNLSSRIFLPNTVVVAEGDIGNEMYFVSHGELNVIIKGNIVVKTFRDGDFFGEIAILLDAKRNATIVARTYCDMSILTKDAFRKVLRRFPEVEKGISKIATARAEATQKQAGAIASASISPKEDGMGAKKKDERMGTTASNSPQSSFNDGQLKGVSAQSVFSNTDESSNNGGADGNQQILSRSPQAQSQQRHPDDREMVPIRSDDPQNPLSSMAAAAAAAAEANRSLNRAAPSDAAVLPANK